MGTTIFLGIALFLGAALLLALAILLFNKVLLKPSFPKGLEPNLPLEGSLDNPSEGVDKAKLDYCIYVEKDGEKLPDKKNRRKLILNVAPYALTAGVNAIAFKQTKKKEVPFDCFTVLASHKEPIEGNVEFPLSKKISSLYVTPYDSGKKALPRLSGIKKFGLAVLLALIAVGVFLLAYLGIVCFFYAFRYGAGTWQFNFGILFRENAFFLPIFCFGVFAIALIYGLLAFRERRLRKGHIHG